MSSTQHNVESKLQIQKSKLTNLFPLADTEIETQLPAPKVFYQSTRLQKKGNTIFSHFPPLPVPSHSSFPPLLTSWGFDVAHFLNRAAAKNNTSSGLH